MINKEFKTLLLLISGFVSLLVISNVLAVKTVDIFGFIGPAAVICYSLTFAFTDTISEVWGKKMAKLTVITGFFAVIISAVFVRLAIELKGSPFWDKQEAYELILGSNLRIVIASLLAYIVSQSHDVWFFHLLKAKTEGRFLWLRNNLSSILSQGLDTVVFIVVAFYGTGAPLWQMIFGQFIIKIGIAVCDTPLVYAMVGTIRKKILDGKEPMFKA